MFITFEGIDGSGKSTQLHLLAQTLEAQGQAVLITHEPGSSTIGPELRQLLLHHPGHVAARAELFLFLADRAQHVSECIAPALDQGQVVLCDRYIDSTVAYQGGGRGLDVAEIQALNQIATGGLMPDITFLLEGPVPVLLQRAKKRSEADRLEQESVAFYERIRQQYLALAQAQPQRFIVLDATQPVTVLQQLVLTPFVTPSL